MKFKRLNIPDVILIEPLWFNDDRGFFATTFQEQKFSVMGIPNLFVEDYYSGSHRGVLRGLHYQIQHPQAKLVRVVRGEIFDVAVDLRFSSPTFGKWVGVYLSEENNYQLWIPRGFAHGFYVLSEWAELVYKVSDFYTPEWERTLLWNDPDLKIDWPLIANVPPLLSDKDMDGQMLWQSDVFE